METLATLGTTSTLECFLGMVCRRGSARVADTARLGGTMVGAAPPRRLVGNTNESGVPGVAGDSGIAGMGPVLIRDPPDPLVDVRLGIDAPVSSQVTRQTGSSGSLPAVIGVLVDIGLSIADILR